VTTLVFSSDLSFGDFLSKSLNQSGIPAEHAITFSAAELSLFKSEPHIAVFVDLNPSELAKLGRAVGEDCHVLVIGDASQRTRIPPHWSFVTTQTSIATVLSTIESFFPSLAEETLTLDGGNSSSLAEHFSTSATNAKDSQHFLDVIGCKKSIGVYGLSQAEINSLPPQFEKMEGEQISCCDLLLVRPDESSEFLSFLQRSQRFLPTALVSLGRSDLYDYLGCSILQLDTLDAPNLVDILYSASRENGPRYVSKQVLSKKDQEVLEVLGCTYGSPSDFYYSTNENGEVEENQRQKALMLSDGLSKDEQRACLWTRAALTRHEESRKVRHLPDLVSCIERTEHPYIIKFYASLRSFGLIVSTLKTYFNVNLISLGGILYGVCEMEDLKNIQSEIQMLEGWTGRDKEGHGWFPKISCVAIKSSVENAAKDLIALSREKSRSSRFSIIENDLSVVHEY